MFINGLSFFLFGHYPSEAKALNQMNEGKFEQYGSFFLYILVIVALGIAGTYLQVYNERKLK
jgi:hypothetical protein